MSEQAKMIFEAVMGSTTATLDADRNRVEILTVDGTPPDPATAARLVQHLADRSGLPVRWNGQTYRPRPRPVDGAEWGE